MATRPEKIKLSNSKNVTNSILQNEMGAENLNPIETSDDLRDLGNMFMNSNRLGDLYFNALASRIMFEVIKSLTFYNPLEKFKKGTIELGETIEEIFIGLTEGQPYNVETAEQEIYKRYTPEIQIKYHSLNYKVFFPITVQRQSLFQKFISFNTLDDYIAKLVNSVYTSAFYTEYLAMMYMIARQTLDGKVKVERVGEITKDNVNELISKLREYGDNFEFPSSLYNFSGVTHNTSRENLHILQSTKFSAIADVESLAVAFNLQYRDFLGQVTKIAPFEEKEQSRLDNIFKDEPNYKKLTTEEIALMQKVHCFLLSKDYFMVYDKLSQMTETFNGRGLYWNYDFHQWKLLSVSPFENCVAFANWTDETLTSIVIATDKTTLQKGAEQIISAELDGTGEIEINLTWVVEGNTSMLTYVDFEGVLRIGENETSTSITVKATQENITSNTLTFTIEE